MQEYIELLKTVVSLTSAVSVTWHSIGISLRVAAKSVVGDSTGREIRELSVKHNDLKASNNKLYYHFIYIAKYYRIVKMTA